MIQEKQVKSLKRWRCNDCGITLGYYDYHLCSFRESKGKVTIDIKGASKIERKCSACGCENKLTSVLKEE